MDLLRRNGDTFRADLEVVEDMWMWMERRCRSEERDQEGIIISDLEDA
jgi:hypothetical protein